MIVLFEDKKPPHYVDGTPSGESAERALFGRASRRKARALAAVADGTLSAEEACRLYGLSADDFATWQRALASFGIRPGRGRAPGPE